MGGSPAYLGVRPTSTPAASGCGRAEPSPGRKIVLWSTEGRPGPETVRAGLTGEDSGDIGAIVVGRRPDCSSRLWRRDGVARLHFKASRLDALGQGLRRSTAARRVRQVSRVIRVTTRRDAARSPARPFTRRPFRG